MRLARDLRLIPVVAMAAGALFVLKTSAIVIEGGYTLISSRAAMAQGLGGNSETQNAPTMPPPAAFDDVVPPRGDRLREDLSRSWIRDIYAPDIITGSVAPPKPEAAAAPPKDQPAPNGAAPVLPATSPAAAPSPDVLAPVVSAGERAVLESLQQRRQELETRAREIEVRDSLLKAAEKRIEARLQEIKDAEARLIGAAQKTDEAESGKFKSLVTMYESMKAKDAAKIFDRLDMRILVELANTMNPRRMSDILGVMSPEAAERLTIEIANRSGAVGRAQAPLELPKIEGRPNKT